MTTNDNNVNQNCRQRPPKTTHLLVELHAGVSPQVRGPRAPILWVREKITTESFHLRLRAKYRTNMEEQGDDGIFGDRTSQRGEDHTSQCAHRNDTAYGNDDQRRSYQTASESKESKERRAWYDKRGSRKGNTPYDDNEDPFVDAATNVDNKSSDLPSQNHYKEELDDAFAQEGHHNTRASRKPRSTNNAESAQYAGRLPTWGQLPMTTTTTTTPTPVKFAYLGLTNMLNRGGARLSTRTKISSELKWQPKNGKDK